MQTGKGVGAGEAICEANCEVWAAWVALMHRLVAAKAIQSFSLAMVYNFWLISKKGFMWGAPLLLLASFRHHRRSLSLFLALGLVLLWAH